MASPWWMAFLWFWNPAGAATEPAPPTYLVGMVSQQYEQKCVGKGGFEAEWVNPYFEVGFSPVGVAAGVKLDGLLGKPVVAKVTAKAGGEAKPMPIMDGRFAKTCVPMQMREDWIPVKSGIRMLRGIGFGFRWSGLEIAEVREVKPLVVTSSGPDVVGVFENDFGFPLEGVAVVFHYEGCYGKPGVAQETREVGALKPGEKKEVRAPAMVLHERTRGGGTGAEHMLVSVQVVSSSPGVVMDLDFPIWFWNLVLECPER